MRGDGFVAPAVRPERGESTRVSQPAELRAADNVRVPGMMSISAFDLFKVGIGPSSSHTVGPMRAAGRFTDSLVADGCLPRLARVRVELIRSLGATGHWRGRRCALRI